MAFIGNGAQLTDLDAGDIASGTLPVVRGGTGTASPSLVGGTGISISGSFPNQTVTSTVTGGVTSLNGQTGAITNTGYNVIGSYAMVVACSGGQGQLNWEVGSTYSGSVIRVGNGITNQSNQTTYNGSLSTPSGTWRAMGVSAGNTDGSSSGGALFVRIS